MHKLMLAWSILALLAGSSVSAGAAESAAVVKADSPQLAAFKKAIREKYDMKEKAFTAHDAETIVTRFYAADAVSVGEGFGIFNGRSQLRPLYDKAVNEYTVKVTSMHTVVNGDAGWDWADFDVMPVDPKAKPFTLAILFLWEKVSGHWICKGDFYADGSFRTGKLTAPTP
ncbi:MAG: hypothetical protein JWN85_4980 [Gammaproteobacteria bacterium]|nr:hypothetical protein [Gammaproteobacteria bacterium]